MPKNPYTIGPFSNDLLAQAKVSPEVVWEGVGTRFPHLEREEVKYRQVHSNLTDLHWRSPKIETLNIIFVE